MVGGSRCVVALRTGMVTTCLGVVSPCLRVVGSSCAVVTLGTGVVIASLGMVGNSRIVVLTCLCVVSIGTLHKPGQLRIVYHILVMVGNRLLMVSGILRHALCFSSYAVGLIDDTLRLVVLAKLFLLYALCFCGNTSLFGGHTALFLTDAGLLLTGSLLFSRYALLLCGHTSLLGCHTGILSIHAALLCRYSSVLILHALRLVSGNGIVECLDAVALFLNARKVDDQEPPRRVSQRMAYVARLQRAIHTQPRGVLHNIGVAIRGGRAICALPRFANQIANLLNFVVHIFSF